MELLKEAKDKQGRPTLRVDISEEETKELRLAINEYPRHQNRDDPQDRRLDALSISNFTMLTQQNIRDLKEVINLRIQQSGSNTLREELGTKLHNFWTLTNP